MSWKQLDSKEKKGAKETFLLISKLAAMVSFSTVVEKLLKSIICSKSTLLQFVHDYSN